MGDMRTCRFCGETLWDNAADTIKYEVRHYAHAACFLKKRGTKGIETLPRSTLGSLNVAQMGALKLTLRDLAAIKRRCDKVHLLGRVGFSTVCGRSGPNRNQSRLDEVTCPDCRAGREVREWTASWSNPHDPLKVHPELRKKPKRSREPRVAQSPEDIVWPDERYMDGDEDCKGCDATLALGDATLALGETLIVISELGLVHASCFERWAREQSDRIKLKPGKGK